MQKIKIDCLNSRIKDKRPKRILSLDGGGTKGIVTIAMLEKLEAGLKDLLPKKEKENFRLNQYFDYIGGTSTGSIIAVLLSLGYSVEKIYNLYMDLSKVVFGGKAKIKSYKSLFGYIGRYKSKPIEEQLEKVFKDKRLSDNSLFNLLAIFTKNTHTNNIWTFNNNPNSKYFDSLPDYSDSYPNKDQYLRDLVRASTAAPVYFPPKELQIRIDSSTKKNKTSLFIDGGVSMDNNPSFRLFLMATASHYNLEWNKGQNALLVTSYGTGLFTQKYSQNLLDVAKQVPGMYINNSSQTVQIIMRGLSNHKAKPDIDKELKDVTPKDFGIEPRLSYLRYNFKYRHMKNKNGGDIHEKDTWAEMDNPETMQELYNLCKEHFIFNISDIGDSFKDHYYDWDNRLIDGESLVNKE